MTDEVFALRNDRDNEGNVTRYFQTAPDFQWVAKDRSGRLDQFEPADMGHIISKIIGPPTGQ